MASAYHMPPGPPYAPKTAVVGGVPTVSVDVPICAVFLLLFLLGAAGHMSILQINLRKGHKFHMSGLMFGFCMARTVTCIMRIVWATRSTNVRVALAAMIFVSAGVILLFIINLLFAQRVLRAAHPHFGWARALHWAFIVFYALILLLLATIITATVQSFYTLNPNSRRIDRDIQLAASTYFMVVSFLPIPMVVVGLLVPRKTRLEKFGSGRWRSKIHILFASAFLLCLGAAFRCGTSFRTPRPRNDPAWYHAKWCFYVFNFVVEILVVYLYLILRVDRRFHVPDGSKGPGDYTRDKQQPHDTPPLSSHSETVILSEEEVFDDEIALGKDESMSLDYYRRSESV